MNTPRFTAGTLIGTLIERPCAAGEPLHVTLRLGESLLLPGALRAFPFADECGCGLFIVFPLARTGPATDGVFKNGLPQAGAFLLGPGETLVVGGAAAKRTFELVAADSLPIANHGGPCALCRDALAGRGRCLTGTGPLHGEILCPQCADAVAGARP